jgi:hypothetical protein
MSGGGEVEEGPDLQFTPTWVVALVCTIIVAVSLAVERSLHYLGKFLKKKDQKSLFQALQKIKEGSSIFYFHLDLIYIHCQCKIIITVNNNCFKNH